MTGRSHQNSSKSHANETIQFRLLIVVAFLWFFSHALLCRLTLRQPDSAIAGESCFQTAKRSAYSVVPYAFMRI
jgi:hypothetical protein